MYGTPLRRLQTIYRQASLAGTDESGGWPTRSQPDVRQDVGIAAHSSRGIGCTASSEPGRIGCAPRVRNIYSSQT